MAAGALSGGLASLLPAASRCLDGFQTRRHAEERHRVEMKRIALVERTAK